MLASPSIQGVLGDDAVSFRVVSEDPDRVASQLPPDDLYLTPDCRRLELRSRWPMAYVDIPMA